jgi:methyltransferase-like protein
MFISKELMVKPAKHSVKFNGVTVIKNDYEDLTAAQRKAYEDEHANPYTQNHEVQTCTIDLANASDNLSYAKTNSFSIKTIKTPDKIFSENANDLSIPEVAFKENFKLKISCDNQVIEEFSLGKLGEVLNLSEKKDTSTEQRDIKLESKDKKLVLFVNFTVE